METIGWILVGGVLMGAIALVGSVTLLLSEAALARVITPLVGFALFFALEQFLQAGPRALKS